MSDDHQSGEQSPTRELDREGRRLARLRLVIENEHAEQPDGRADDFDPEPEHAA